MFLDGAFFFLSHSQDCGPVTSLSFRSDGQPIMVSASRAGHLAIWDLEERKLTGQMRQAHNAEVAAVTCLTQEPLMVTSSADNTLKQVKKENERKGKD